MNRNEIKERTVNTFALMRAFGKLLFSNQKPKQESVRYISDQDFKRAEEMAKVYESLANLDREGSSWEQIQSDLIRKINGLDVVKDYSLLGHNLDESDIIYLGFEPRIPDKYLLNSKAGPSFYLKDKENKAQKMRFK